MSDEIDLAELKELVSGLIDHAIENSSGIVSISPDEDLYWSIDWDSLSDIRSPPQPSLGRLRDDLEFLRSTKQEDARAALCLIHAAALLRYVAKKIKA